MIDMGEEAAEGLKRVSWDEVGVDVYVPMWANRVRQYAPALAGVTFAALPEFARQPQRLVAHLLASAPRPLSADEPDRGVGSVLGAALLLALMEQGWQVNMELGAEVEAHRGDERVAPFGLVRGLMSGQTNAETWRELCTGYGIASLDVAQVAWAQRHSVGVGVE